MLSQNIVREINEILQVYERGLECPVIKVDEDSRGIVVWVRYNDTLVDVVMPEIYNVDPLNEHYRSVKHYEAVVEHQVVRNEVHETIVVKCEDTSAERYIGLVSYRPELVTHILVE